MEHFRSLATRFAKTTRNYPHGRDRVSCHPAQTLTSQSLSCFFPKIHFIPVRTQQRFVDTLESWRQTKPIQAPITQQITGFCYRIATTLGHGFVEKVHENARAFRPASLSFPRK